MVTLRLPLLYHDQEVVGSFPAAHNYLRLDDAILKLLNVGALDSKRIVKIVRGVLPGSLLAKIGRGNEKPESSYYFLF